MNRTLLSIISILGLIIITFVISCKNEEEVNYGEKQMKEMVFNDTLELGLHEYLYNSSYNLRLDYESMIQDCRCPANANCIWAGYASVQLELTIGDNDPIPFVLGTMNGENLGISRDTTFEGFEIKLINCLPYPGLDDQSEQRVLVTVKPTTQN
jgi:hypothetical protein